MEDLYVRLSIFYSLIITISFLTAVDASAMGSAPQQQTPRPSVPRPINENGWITTSMWVAPSGNPIQRFETTWTVPNDPAYQNGQLIYLFNGLMDISNQAILQPVLQWGRSQAGGGSYWAVASWYVPTGGQLRTSQLTRVSPGQVLKGVMTLTGTSGGGYDYRSEFEGMPQTILDVSGVAQLQIASETLEAYYMTDCSQYPAGITSFSNIGMDMAQAISDVSWWTVNYTSGCGHQTNIVDRSALNGQIDLTLNL